MKITIEIGPNRVTKVLSRLRNSIKSGKEGLKAGWREGYPAKSRNRTTADKAAKAA